MIRNISALLKALEQKFEVQFSAYLNFIKMRKVLKRKHFGALKVFSKQPPTNFVYQLSSLFALLSIKL